MSVASDRVRSTVIEATEFPELSRAYQVMGVPKVVINDRVQFEGALPGARLPERGAPGGGDPLSGFGAPPGAPLCLRHPDARLLAASRARLGIDLPRRGRGPRTPARPRPLPRIDRRRRARARQRSTGWTTLNFSRCSTGRRGTISSVAARSSRSRTAGAREPGSTATAGHRIGRSPSRTGTTGECARDPSQENVNGDDRR